MIQIKRIFSNPYTKTFRFSIPTSSNANYGFMAKYHRASFSSISSHSLNVPNAITLSRIVMTPFIGVCIANHQLDWAIGLLTAAAASDFLDGWIARRFKLKTPLGSILDPAADKILMATLVISLSKVGLLPYPLAVLIVGRDLFLGMRTLYIRYSTLESPKTFARFWDYRVSTAEIQPSLISKANTALQLLLMLTTLLNSAYGIPNQLLLEGLRFVMSHLVI